MQGKGIIVAVDLGNGELLALAEIDEKEFDVMVTDEVPSQVRAKTNVRIEAESMEKRKMFSAEQIIMKLRKAEVLLGQGKTVKEICRVLEIRSANRPITAGARSMGYLTNARLKNLGAGLSLDSVMLTDAHVLIEICRRQNNTIKPHSALGYRPPARLRLVPNLLRLYQLD